MQIGQLTGDQAGPAAVGVVCAAAAAPQASLTQQIKPVVSFDGLR